MFNDEDANDHLPEDQTRVMGGRNMSGVILTTLCPLLLSSQEIPTFIHYIAQENLTSTSSPTKSASLGAPLSLLTEPNRRTPYFKKYNGYL